MPPRERDRYQGYLLAVFGSYTLTATGHRPASAAVQVRADESVETVLSLAPVGADDAATEGTADTVEWSHR